jgi:hypothetical protein
VNNSSSLSCSSTATSTSKSIQNKSKDAINDDLIAINEKISLTKHQHQVLKIICDTYQMSFSEYMQQALVEAIRFDIDEGNLCDALLEKIGEDNKKDNSPPPSSHYSYAPDMKGSDLDLLKKLQTQISYYSLIVSSSDSLSVATLDFYFS